MNLIQSCDIATPFEVWVQIFPMNVNGERLCNSFNKDPVKWDVEARLCNVEPNGKEWDTVGGTTAWVDTKSFWIRLKLVLMLRVWLRNISLSGIKTVRGFCPMMSGTSNNWPKEKGRICVLFCACNFASKKFSPISMYERSECLLLFRL